MGCIPSKDEESGGTTPASQPKASPNKKSRAGADGGGHHVRNVFATPIEEEALANFKPPVHEKSAEEKAFIRDALKHNFVFEHLHPKELHPLLMAFEKTTVAPDELIIKQGDEGDYFYICQTGSFKFIVNDKEVGEAGAGASFGELALMYKSPRAATVKAAEAATLFRVDQKTFRFIMQKQTQKGQADKVALLQGVDFLKDLQIQELSKLSHAMTPRPFTKGEYLMRKGDAADFFYLLSEGTCMATDVGVGDTKYEDVSYKAGDFFGERALVTGDPRAANVVASSDGMAFCIDKKTFELVLGDLEGACIRSQDKTRLVSSTRVVRFVLCDTEDAARGEREWAIIHCLTPSAFFLVCLGFAATPCSNHSCRRE